MSSSIVDARERLGGAWLGRSALLASRSLIDSKPQLRGIGPRLCRRLRRHAVFDLKQRQLLLRESLDVARDADKNSRSKSCRCLDRKSTRLNSSHDQISYSVFCLKKIHLPTP